MGTVLVVDDERGVREGLVRAVASVGHRTVAAASIAEAREAVAREELDCVLLDVRLKDGDGLVFLSELRAGSNRELPVIIATAYGDSERTIRAMKTGAFEYVTKPFDLPVLLGAVERAVKSRALARALPPAAKAAAAGSLVGVSAPMLDIWKLIGRAAASDAPVLVLGETGTGKELVARAIHDHSSRAVQPFVAVNVAALSQTLLESELMGHEKGAFTGAITRKLGRFELASSGTLFLDEMGDLDVSLQTKLLRVLQDGRFERVGGSETLTSSARIVAATNKAVRPGDPAATLREDLYYRLAVIEIFLPPLRARRSDIPLLVTHALERTRARAVSEEAMARLASYRWPGNVRELLHVIERAALMCSAEVIDVGDLPSALGEAPLPAPGALSEYDDLPLRDAVQALEKRMIERALERSGGNRAQAARLLGIARPQLYAKMDDLGMTEKK
ncbi:MAG TPA: sigma-54 dependent transcriptional regulator [Polyangiaceae bacterium]|jgi:two-component system response regulator AtoC|nr:sigma-54 dependent transcriptional regulator [Polyangiaceae bacterium]